MCKLRAGAGIRLKAGERDMQGSHGNSGDIVVPTSPVDVNGEVSVGQKDQTSDHLLLNDLSNCW